jgi:hypothetical protein
VEGGTCGECAGVWMMCEGWCCWRFFSLSLCCVVGFVEGKNGWMDGRKIPKCFSVFVCGFMG